MTNDEAIAIHRNTAAKLLNEAIDKLDMAIKVMVRVRGDVQVLAYPIQDALDMVGDVMDALTDEEPENE